MLFPQFDLGINLSYRSFEQSREYVMALKLEDRAQFRLFAVSRQRPANIPFNPTRIYADEWVSWDHFLGKETGETGLHNLLVDNEDNASPTSVSASEAPARVKKEVRVFRSICTHTHDRGS